MDLHRNFVFSLALGVFEKLQHGTQWHRSLNLFLKKELSAQGQGEFSISFFSHSPSHPKIFDCINLHDKYERLVAFGVRGRHTNEMKKNFFIV